jgi:spore coat protein U-like protein
VGLSPGASTGATVTTRAMTSAANATVSYAVYRDSGHTQNWGQTVGTDTLSGTGTGAVQNYTAYGSVAAQTTPAAGAYTDQLTVTVTY